MKTLKQLTNTVTKSSRPLLLRARSSVQCDPPLPSVAFVPAMGGITRCIYTVTSTFCKYSVVIMMTPSTPPWFLAALRSSAACRLWSLSSEGCWHITQRLRMLDDSWGKLLCSSCVLVNDRICVLGLQSVPFISLLWLNSRRFSGYHAVSRTCSPAGIISVVVLYMYFASLQYY